MTAKKSITPTTTRIIWRDGDIEVALADYPPFGRMPTHSHDALGISVVLSGAVEELVGRKSVQAGVGGAVVKPAGTPHANRFGPEGARLISVGLRRTQAELWRRTGGLSRWVWVHATAALGTAARLVRFAGQTDARDAEYAEDLLLRVAELSIEDGRRRGVGRPPRWLTSVRDRLHTEHASTCRVSALADEAGVHPVHLARVFRRHYGQTVTEYLHQLRVLASAHQLALGDAPVARVAADAGFADHSHLCRIFGRAIGMSPTAYRLAARR